jgi:hypothetical protein
MKWIVRTLCVAPILLTFAALAQGPTPANRNSAENNPDRVSWQLFVQVTAPAATPGNNNVLFETWASDDDTFTTSPVWPSTAPVAKLKAPALLRFAALGRVPKVRAVPIPAGANVGEEVRRNKAAFDFIVGHNLHTRAGLRQAFAANQVIAFGADAIEVKANWVRANSVNASLYHVNTASNGQKYALVSLHIISKLIPNWTWATFEHINNPGRCDYIGCRDNFGATNSFVAPMTPAGGQYSACNKVQALNDMFAAGNLEPAFQNYCLKGSQVDFTSTTGLPTLLGNSVTENGFASSSSCLTCHSRASVDSDGDDAQGAGFLPNGQSPNGAPRAVWFWNAPGSPDQSLKAFQTDFVWSIPLLAVGP